MLVLLRLPDDLVQLRCNCGKAVRGWALDVYPSNQYDTGVVVHEAGRGRRERGRARERDRQRKRGRVSVIEIERFGLRDHRGQGCGWNNLSHGRFGVKTVDLNGGLGDTGPDVSSTCWPLKRTGITYSVLFPLTVTQGRVLKLVVLCLKHSPEGKEKNHHSSSRIISLPGQCLRTLADRHLTNVSDSHLPDF